MLFSQLNIITELYFWIDQIVPKKLSTSLGGRPTLMSDSEIITLLVFNTVIVKQKTLKDIHTWALTYHLHDFPHLSTYTTFVEQCHRVSSLLSIILKELLSTNSPLCFLDSTMLPVCTHKRADDHKVAKNEANFGKNWQGWHYGFKLHASVDPFGRLCAVEFTKASVFDGSMTSKLITKSTKVAVADRSYGGQKLREQVWKEYNAFIFTPPLPSQKQKIVALWQHYLLSYRSKIECVFDYLKNHLSLVSSFPRSVRGYFLHYNRILLGYQIRCLIGSGAKK